MSRGFIFACVSASCIALSGVASAAVVNGVSTQPNREFVKLTVPFTPPNKGNVNDVGLDNFNTDDKYYAFDELQNFTLDAPLTIQTAKTNGIRYTETTLAPDTVVSSHFVFFDPRKTNRVIASIIFDADILGFAATNAALNSTDFLGNPAVNYIKVNENNVPVDRGLEQSDRISFSGNSLDINWAAISPGDAVRVFTAGSPSASVVSLPAALPLLLTAMAGLGFMGYRRRRTT